MKKFAAWLLAFLKNLFSKKKNKEDEGSSGTTTGGTSTPPVSATVTFPEGILGVPNSDLLVKVKAVEDFRAKYLATPDTDADPNNQWWAKHLPHWWAVDEVARSLPSTNAAGQYVIAQCNKKMLVGALNHNNTNSWVPWIERPGSIEHYDNPLDAAVVAGPNNFGPLAATGFPGIKIADFPALLEANRKMINAGGKRSDDDTRVASPGKGGGGKFKI